MTRSIKIDKGHLAFAAIFALALAALFVFSLVRDSKASAATVPAHLMQPTWPAKVGATTQICARTIESNVFQVTFRATHGAFDSRYGRGSGAASQTCITYTPRHRGTDLIKVYSHDVLVDVREISVR